MTKQIVLTGATAGIGRSAALSLARQGHALTLVGRSRGKIDALKAELLQSGAKSVDAEIADLSSMAQTVAAGQRLAQRLPQIDVLALNAGAFFRDRGVTDEGFEQTFATNHLAPFALTLQLLGVLDKTPEARVVVTASNAHRTVKHLDFADLQSERWRLIGFAAYGASKLANILFVRALGRRLRAAGAMAHGYHPGFVASDFAKNNGAFSRFATAALRPFARSVDRGADTLVWLATAPEVTGTGGYWFDRQPSACSPAASDDAAAERLWAASEQLLARWCGGAEETAQGQ